MHAPDEQPAQSADEKKEPASPTQGFVYPPPPSFYQDMVVPAQNPPLPPQAAQPPVMYPTAPALQPPAHPQASMYAPPFVSQPPAKKSHKWVWIVATILSVLVLVGCGLCGWSVYTVFNSAFQQVAGSLDVVDDYYTNLQAQNYAAAYSDLASQGQISNLTQAQFTQQAQERDNQYGQVKSFVPNQPNFVNDPNTGPDLSHFTITVNVTRIHLSYSVLLNVRKIGANWKITEYDQI